MELSSLLNALVQGAETGVLTQVASNNSSSSGGNGAAAGQPGFSLPGQSGAPLLNLTGQSSGAGGQAGLAAGQGGPGVVGQSGLGLAGQGGVATGGLAPGGLTGAGAGLTAQLASGTSVTVAQGGGLSVSVQAQRGAQLTNLPTLADTYHGSEAPASPSLLSQSGVGAYIHLLNAFASHATDDKSANLLTNNLGNASATLKSAYSEAVSMLPSELQQKDWSFSVSDGTLVFTDGKDVLSSRDLADLQKAFTAANVELPAREVATAITSMAERRQAGMEPNSLAWSGIQADESNFGDVVNLRDYVTTTVPGSNYHPNTPAPAVPPQIPIVLGGMDLRELVSSRPNFFRVDGSVVTEPDEEILEEAAPVEEAGTLQGQCSCGEVRFSVENTFDYAFYCHCSRCRLRTGSAFAAVAGVEVEKVQVTAGTDHLLIERECSDGYGARCSRCYAFLFAVVRGRKYMHVSLGVLDGTPSRLPDHHVHVASKAPWFEITDGLPQYEELPPQDEVASAGQ